MHQIQGLVRILLLITLISAIQSCADIAMTGAQAFYNRRALQKNISDHVITLKAYKSIQLDDKRFRNTNIAVATFNGEVLLAGEVPEHWQREEAEKKIKQISNVKRIYNLVKISSPSSNLQRVSDAWLTAKIKAKMFTSNDLDPSQIKVVTENGIVYLMGILKPEEADAAVDIASNTDGVEKVIKMFSYMHISKNYHHA